MAATRKANHLLKLNFTLELSLETQEWSVGLGKTVAKVFKNGWERPWDATLNKSVPQIIRMFVSDLGSKILFCSQSEASIYHAAFMIFLYKGVNL